MKLRTLAAAIFGLATLIAPHPNFVTPGMPLTILEIAAERSL
jgi:hypothetical protein